MFTLGCKCVFLSIPLGLTKEDVTSMISEFVEVQDCFIVKSKTGLRTNRACVLVRSYDGLPDAISFDCYGRLTSIRLNKDTSKKQCFRCQALDHLIANCPVEEFHDARVRFRHICVKQVDKMSKLISVADVDAGHQERVFYDKRRGG